MEIFVFPELMYSLVLANIMSPIIWRWRQEDCFKKLGPHIKSCHAKDIILSEDVYTPHLDEVRPGLGKLDYAVFLKELSKFPNTPLMMEHLPNAKEYGLAADYIRSIAEKLNLSFT